MPTRINMLVDKHGRQLKDLRISVTDRCNFRCRYCMPREKFGSNHAFMPRRSFLSFEEIEKVVVSCKELGLEKVRITGGEPLLRPKLHELIKKLSKLNLDIALTTNGSLLRKHAKELAAAGLDRVTISLDALSQEIHTKMTDSQTSIETILDGIDAAIEFGLTPVKVNCVVQKGVNEAEVKKLVSHFQGTDVIVRFIEYMDVGCTNDWMLGQVIPSKDLLKYLQKDFDLIPINSISTSDVAKRWMHSDNSGEIGVISSVSNPFCGDCVRARLSANGYLHTCLFASGGHDLRAIIHNSEDIKTLTNAIKAIWARRDDRYSEQRSTGNSALPRIEMSYIGG